MERDEEATSEYDNFPPPDWSETGEIIFDTSEVNEGDIPQAPGQNTADCGYAGDPFYFSSFGAGFDLGRGEPYATGHQAFSAIAEHVPGDGAHPITAAQV